jgi:chromosome segregation ATPase
MAQQAKRTTRKSTAATTRARASGEKALQRLQDSVDAAEAALKDLRKEMGRGSRELLTDVETTLRDARKNLRRVSRSVVKDLEGVQKAAAGKRTTQRRASARPAKRRTTTRARTAKK